MSPAASTDRSTTEKNHRHKIAAACDQCRERKTRCDGVRPICTPCTRRPGLSTSCLWGERRKRGRSSRKREAIECSPRLASTSSASQKLQASCDSPGSGYVTDPSDSRLAEEATFDSDAMLGLLEKGCNHRQHPRPDSSLSSFILGLKELLNRPKSLTDPRNAALESLDQVLQPRTRNVSVEDQTGFHVLLPPRHVADQLLQTYWDLVHPLYPFLDSAEFEVFYEALWIGTSLDSDRQLFICLLNAIFCLASTIDPNLEPERRGNQASVYFKQSLQLLGSKAFHYPSLLKVQCYLVLGQYLQSTADSQRCWTFVGMAIRTAQILGLDMPPFRARQTDFSDQELRRRVWHGCVLMDRALSMTFGRPTMISVKDTSLVPRPAAHIDEPCNCHNVMYDSTKPRVDMHFFIEALKLYELMDEALATVYNRAGCSNSNMPDEYACYFGDGAGKAVGTIADIEGRLHTWAKSLPIHLQFGSQGTKSLVALRQTHVLRLRYLHTRVLLLRPVFSRFCALQVHQSKNSSSGPTPNLPRSIALELSVACVGAALDTVEMFSAQTRDRRVDELKSLLPAWWYSVFYIYSAYMVLAVAQACPRVFEKLGPRIADACAAVKDLLALFVPFGGLAKRCALVVGIISKEIEQAVKDHQGRVEFTTLSGDMAVPQNEQMGPSAALSHTLGVEPVGSESFQALALSLDFQDMPELYQEPDFSVEGLFTTPQDAFDLHFVGGDPSAKVLVEKNWDFL